MRLKPGWFLNMDARKLDFTNVTWFRTGIEENFSAFGPTYRLLAITYRELAVNAEEHHRYAEASDFRYLAMDVKRFERISTSRIRWPRKLAVWQLSWWYWLASGYGERTHRAALGLLITWLSFAVVFAFVGFVRWEPKLTNALEAGIAIHDITGAPLSFPRALSYSGAVLTLQKPEPRPATNAARTAVLVETVLGPIQAALLALAIRRKFIR